MWQNVGWLTSLCCSQFGAATESLTKATIDGDLDVGVQFIGQSQGLIHDVPTVDDLIQRIMQEAHDVSVNRATLFESRLGEAQEEKEAC